MSTAKPKLLVIDDSIDILDLIELYCYRDFDVYTAENGFEGLKMAQEHHPDLIITDIMMPGVDGIQLLNDLRKSGNTALIPVVAMTSFVKKITRKSLLNIGFNDVIPKPVDREKLKEALQRLLVSKLPPADKRPTDEKK